MGTQRLIAINDARSIVNTYYYGVSYARPGLLRMRRSTSRALERSVTFFALVKRTRSNLQNRPL